MIGPVILDMNAALADVSAVSEPADAALADGEGTDSTTGRDDLHVYALARSSSGELLLGHVSHSSHSSHSSGGGHYSHASHSSHSSHVSGGPGHFSSHHSGGPSHHSGGPTQHPTAAAAQGRPDMRIAASGGALRGNDIYGSIKPQTVEQSGSASATMKWEVSVQNDAAMSDQIKVRGAKSAHGFEVTYLDADGKDVTRQVEAGTFRTPRLAHGATYRLTVVVAVGDEAAPGQSLSGKVAGYSVTSPNRTDAVEFVATRS